MPGFVLTPGTREVGRAGPGIDPDEDLVTRSRSGDMEAYAKLIERHEGGGWCIRNLGAMIALELVKDGDMKKPDADLTKAICAKAAEKGLILLSCGTRANVIRFLPPLTTEMEIIDEGMALLKTIIKELI